MEPVSQDFQMRMARIADCLTKCIKYGHKGFYIHLKYFHLGSHVKASGVERSECNNHVSLINKHSHTVGGYFLHSFERHTGKYANTALHPTYSVKITSPVLSLKSKHLVLN
jgi:hypothetical protein